MREQRTEAVIDLCAAEELTAARDLCRRIFGECFGCACEQPYAGDPAEYTPAGRGALICARSLGRVVGAMALRPLDRCPEIAARFEERYPVAREIGVVTQAVVAADMRRRGIGRRLFLRLEELAQSYGLTAKEVIDKFAAGRLSELTPEKACGGHGCH